MDHTATLLITAPPASLVHEIERRRPGWRVVALDDRLPEGPLDTGLWGFIDWLGTSMSGIEMCRRLRESPFTRHARLTMVIDDGESETRRRALQAGADDYLVGPLDAARLIERVESAAGRVAPPQARQLANGTVLLDPVAHQVRVDGRLVPIRPNEFRLLAHFLANPDKVFSRGALIEHLGKDGDALDERTVDVWVGRLRRAIIAAGAPDPLRTVRSLGYVMDSLG